MQNSTSAHGTTHIYLTTYLHDSKPSIPHIKNTFGYLFQLFPHLKCISFDYMFLAFCSAFYRIIIIIMLLRNYPILFQKYSELFSTITNLKLTPINNYLFSFTLPACLTCCWHNMEQHLNLTGEQSPAAVGILPAYQVSPIIQHHLAHCSLRYPEICLT